MSIPNVLGSINEGDSFVITQVLNGQPTALNFAITSQGIKYYYFGADFPTVSTNPNFPIFTARKVGNGISIKDTINGGFISFSASYPYSINGTSTTIVVSSPLAPWGGSSIALSQVQYQMNVNGVVAQFKFGRQGSGVEGLVPGLYFLPASWFFCNSTGGSVAINQKNQILANWYCFYDPTLEVCTSGSPPVYPSGFVNLQECLSQTPYSYCFADTTCGTSDCKGPCPSGNTSDCTLTDGSFKCIGDPSAPENVWWRSTWFIILASGIGIVAAIAIGVGIYFIVRSNKKSNDDEKNDKDDETE